MFGVVYVLARVAHYYPLYFGAARHRRTQEQNKCQKAEETEELLDFLHKCVGKSLKMGGKYQR